MIPGGRWAVPAATGDGCAAGYGLLVGQRSARGAGHGHDGVRVRGTDLDRTDAQRDKIDPSPVPETLPVATSPADAPTVISVSGASRTPLPHQ